MAYPPPPYADAVCGTHVCGEAICGAWWAYPAAPNLRLGAEEVAADGINGDVPPPARLKLGAETPVARVSRTEAVPVAGLRLGTVEPEYVGIFFVRAAGIRLGGYAPSYKLTTLLAVPDARLLLGGYAPEYVGALLLTPIACEEVDLDPVGCETPVLVGGSRSISLQAPSAPALILMEAPGGSVSLTGVES